MTIRPMAAGDLDAVMRLAAATPEAPHWGVEGYRGFLVTDGKQPRRIFVAEIGGALVGFIAGQITVDVCELESIVVAAEHRRAGAGSALVAALVDWADDFRAGKVQLEVRAGNCSAISFYERLGFVQDGLRRGYYRDPEEDAVLMSRVLFVPHSSKSA